MYSTDGSKHQSRITAATAALQRSAASYGFVAHHSEVVAIRIEREGAVVVGVIVGPQTRCAVIASAGRERGPIKRIHLRAARGPEGHVDWRPMGLTAADPEIRLWRQAKARCGAVPCQLGRQVVQQLIANRLQRLGIERLAGRKVAHAQTHVVDHRCYLRRGGNSLPSGSDRNRTTQQLLDRAQSLALLAADQRDRKS